MNVYDRAHELAKALSMSQEYRDLKKAKDEAEANVTNKKMIQDISEKKLELQSAQLMGQELDPEKVKHFESLLEIVKVNPAVSNYLNTEYRFQVMMADIQKIIVEAVGLGDLIKK
jgi:cell fate (sporulation/competence/biofilm development) regulator YlbF (YheA/YmcA/DUF963 family)